jgi:hypothetical protein
MPNTGNFWTPDEIQSLLNAWQAKPGWVSIREFCKSFGKKSGRGENSIRGQINRMMNDGHIGRQYITASPYPVYDTPLVMDGDALILPDLEFPFHEAEFVNKVLELAEKWGIRQCILAGDVLHFDSLSGWGAEWSIPNNGGITADAEKKLVDFAKTLSSRKQQEFFGLIGDIGERTQQDGMSTELSIARKELGRMSHLFDRIDFLLGNHEGRLLRALETTINPDELLRLLSAKDGWRIAPFYYSYLDTPAGRFQIEHPKGAAEGTAQQLAAKFHNHVIMAHSHLLDFSWDISGKFYAIHAGCCVDENRLAYAAQRHVTKRAHKLGAVIVMNGYPYLLHDRTDWEALGRMK